MIPITKIPDRNTITIGDNRKRLSFSYTMIYPTTAPGRSIITCRFDSCSPTIYLRLIIDDRIFRIDKSVSPLGVMVYRAQMGAANPSDIFLPILIATYCSTLAGLIAVCLKQKINLFDRVIMGSILGLTAIIGSILYFFAELPQEKVSLYSQFGANCLLFCIIISFIIAGIRKKINIYDAFIEGAKEGFKTAVTIIPYLVAMLVAIAIFRASGAMDFIISGITAGINACGIDSDFVGALPTALMKPLSGSGARGMMVDAMNTYGADSFVARVASTIQGSTDTTFYILAVYFGSVGIRNTRYSAGYGLFADLVGIIAAIVVAYIFFK